jgi:hypothetical protein
MVVMAVSAGGILFVRCYSIDALLAVRPSRSIPSDNRRGLGFATRTAFETEQRRADRCIGLCDRKQLIYDTADGRARGRGNHGRLMSITPRGRAPFDDDASAKDRGSTDGFFEGHLDRDESAAGEVPLERMMALRIS